MKFTLSWLREHLETTAAGDEIVSTLTAIGLEVEEVIDKSALLAPFRVAEVISVEPHPDADRLKVCQVDTGSGTVQVVCGAPNARAGMKGVFAAAGTTIPGTGLELKSTKIRGVVSNGMLCSEREMMLSDEHEGIIELAEDAPVGAPYAELAGLDELIFDIAITPNRQDCLGVGGIARDLAAAGLGKLKDTAPEEVPGAFRSPIGVELDFGKENAEACPLFVGRYIRGLKNPESPAWLRDRLTDIGLRPISALVDITNLVTIDRARPLHVFDAGKVSGNIRARLAKKGETLEALDGKTYALTGSETVITDEGGVLGLGGVIGGEATACTPETTDVFVEAAYFDPLRTATTGRKHGIESDARYRFERGIDPNFVIPGMELATRLILDICGGEASELVIAGKVPVFAKTVSFRPGRVETLGGIGLAPEDCRAILESLGFKVTGKGSKVFKVKVPSWRSDVDGEADLVEEVLRIKGYDAIPAVAMKRAEAVAVPTLTAGQRQARAVRRRLAAEGLVECITWSFMPGPMAELFGLEGDQLRLENPISSELDVMRPSILPNLLWAAGRNADRSIKSVALFEVGPQYSDTTPEGQALVAAGVRAGEAAPRHWSGPVGGLDLFDAKADALAALEAAGAPVGNLQVFSEAPGWYHPGRSGSFRLGPKNILANFGEVHPAVLSELGIDGPAVAFEVYLDAVPAPRGGRLRTRKALEASDLQPVERDFAFLVDQKISAQEIVRAAAATDRERVKAVSVFDLYEGSKMEAGKKSLAISVRLEPVSSTFTDQEIDDLCERIIERVCSKTGGLLRH
ncbi:MAG: phenylalanine--tRNA ligase subunit beta [Sphingomonadales bacterium]